MLPLDSWLRRTEAFANLTCAEAAQHIGVTLFGIMLWSCLVISLLLLSTTTMLSLSFSLVLISSFVTLVYFASLLLSQCGIHITYNTGLFRRYVYWQHRQQRDKIKGSEGGIADPVAVGDQFFVNLVCDVFLK